MDVTLQSGQAYIQTAPTISSHLPNTLPNLNGFWAYCPQASYTSTKHNSNILTNETAAYFTSNWTIVSPQPPPCKLLGVGPMNHEPINPTRPTPFHRTSLIPVHQPSTTPTYLGSSPFDPRPNTKAPQGL
ncbi:hypothetical protein BJY04DRAFT_195749 [Aspergillus karnatakaensis]|uniref:uncharacterized protein n=1 Tax=Aspergillus karnatakaensis TaxID=1810916 RepID=UPI003CCD3AF5